MDGLLLDEMEAKKRNERLCGSKPTMDETAIAEALEKSYRTKSFVEIQLNELNPECTINYRALFRPCVETRVFLFRTLRERN